MKLVNDVPRSSHSYLVENVFTSGYILVKTELMARFFDKLKNSKSTEVQFLVNIVSQDIRSTTARNLNLVSKETGKCLRNLSPKVVRELVRTPGVPDRQLWRVNLLQRLLRDRRHLESLAMNTEDITDMINSLCSS